MNAYVAPEQEHLSACRKWQEYFDNHLRDVGARVPEPTLGQHPNDYLRESCRTFKRSFLPPNHDLYQVQWRGLRGDALDALVPQLMTACKAEANNPNTVPPGEFRQVKVHNPYTGRVDAIKFIGPECFTKQLGRPGRPIKSFWGPVDSQGRQMRPINTSGRSKQGWAA
jgi:hypothetical protein